MSEDLEAMLAGHACCDFCGCDEPAYVYPAESYGVTSPNDGKQSWSEGAWVACAVCKSVIERNSIRDLVDHAVREFFLRRPGLEERLGLAGVRKVRREAAALYAGFRKARLAEPVPFG